MGQEELIGPFCQSCGMPLEADEDYGTDADGSQAQDYCRYCFQDGEFTEPELTAEQMIDKCVAIMVKHDIMPEDQARVLMGEVIPRLKRWRQ